MIHAAALSDALIALGLDPDRAAKVGGIPHETVQVPTGSPFREPGAPRQEVMLVRSGIVCKYKVAAGGARQIVALRFPGEMILPRLGPAPYGLQALVKSELIVANGRIFTMMVTADPELVKIVTGVIQRNESIAYEWLVNCGRRDAAARVVHILLETAVRARVDLKSQPLTIPFTQEQIAQITGQTSVNVNRVFADIQRTGWIEKKGRQIIFKNVAALEEVADFDPTYLRYPWL